MADCSFISLNLDSGDVLAGGVVGLFEGIRKLFKVGFGDLDDNGGLCAGHYLRISSMVLQVLIVNKLCHSSL